MLWDIVTLYLENDRSSLIINGRKREKNKLDMLVIMYLTNTLSISFYLDYFEKKEKKANLINSYFFFSLISPIILLQCYYCKSREKVRVRV